MTANDFWQEPRRLHFVLPRAHCLNRPASVLPVDFLFGVLKNSIFRRVLGGREEERLLREARRSEIWSIPEDVFLRVYVSIWPVNLFVGFLRARTLSSSSSRARGRQISWPTDSRSHGCRSCRNDFCAKLVVCILSIAEDVFCHVYISIWPVDLFVGFSQGSTLSSSSSMA